MRAPSCQAITRMIAALCNGVIPLCTVTASTAHSTEPTAHHFDAQGAYQAQGFPSHTPTLFALAEKPLTFHFSGLPADWNPDVHIHRTTSARLLEIDPVEAKLVGTVWQLTWTPPATQGPAKYLIRLQGEPKRAVRIEIRATTWLTVTRDALAKAEWQASGLSPEERNALDSIGIATRSNKATFASLEMRPRQGDASRRRIVWDEENPHLLVWRPGPAAGDLEARAPRWWISPAALATDHGLIRFLDLYSEPPLKP